MNLLVCNNLSKKYGNKTIIDSIDIEIPDNRITLLTGKNSSGKSTLLKMVNDLVIPSKGKILFKGKELDIESKKEIAFLSQINYLNDSDSVDTLLELFNDFYDNFNIKKARKLIKELKIDNLKISKMPLDMQDKLRFVLVMSRDCSLYILDEPLKNVDLPTRDMILKKVIPSYRNKSSIIIATTIIGNIDKIIDDVIILDNGRIVLSSSYEELVKKEKKSLDEIFRGIVND